MIALPLESAEAEKQPTAALTCQYRMKKRHRPERQLPFHAADRQNAGRPYPPRPAWQLEMLTKAPRKSRH